MVVRLTYAIGGYATIGCVVVTLLIIMELLLSI